MKKITKILALVLAGCLALLLLLSCDKNKEYSKMALDYLQDKYDENDFSVNSVVREGKTSGRYVVNAQCNDDDVKFDVFVYSSILISDGYSVTKANMKMNDVFEELLVENNLKDSVESVTWLRLFNEQDTDYSFVTVDNPDEVSREDVSSIYKVLLSSKLNLEDVAKTIKEFSDVVTNEFEGLQNVTYEFAIDGKTYDATLPVSVISEKSSEDVKDFLDKKISAQSENEPVRNFYWMESEVVVITVEEETDVIVTTDPSTPNL